MKKALLVLYVSIACLLCGCSSGSNDTTAYKDLKFGMTLDEVRSKGFCSDTHPITKDGMLNYKCSTSDFAGCQYEKAELIFKNNKLVKVYFFNSTSDPEKQKEISKKVTNYLTSNFGPSRNINKCEGWKDKNRTFILYIHSNVEENMKSTYINELAIFSNDLYKSQE